MFNGCSSLSALDLSNFNTANVTNMSNMFNGCSSLLALDLSSFNTAKVTNMESMFSGCIELKTILVDYMWITAQVSKSSLMFNSCRVLRGGQGSTWYEYMYSDKGYARIDGGIEKPGYLTKVDTPVCELRAYAVLQDNTLIFYYNDKMPEDAYDISIGNLSYQNASITKVIFDKSFEEFRPIRCAMWFKGCTALTEICNMKEYLNTAKVMDMSSMFSGCSSLTSLDLSSFNTAKVRNMSSMFSGCSSLTSLDLNSFKTANVTNMSYMFSGCSSITSLDLSVWNMINVTASYMFSNCGGLIWIRFGANGYDIQNTSYMFYKCSRLETIFSEHNWDKKNSYEMFRGCIRLKSDYGTAYDSEHVDGEYALLDGYIYGERYYPGYFSQFAPESIIVKDMPKTEYFIGEDLSLFGGTLQITHKKAGSNQKTHIVSLAQADISGFDAQKVGKQTLKVKYLGLETSFTVNVTAKAAVSIEVSKLPETKYLEGGKLSLDGGVITVKYNDGTSEDVDMAKANVFGFDPDKIGEQSLTLKYVGCETNYTVYVTAKTAVSIEVKQLPETKYLEGYKLSLDGGIITVKYNNGTSEDVDIVKAEISGFVSDKIGEQILTVKYLGLTTNYTVYVTAKTAVSIEVTKQPETKYLEGDKLTIAGGVITVKYNNGESENIDIARAEVSGFSPDKIGVQALIVNYLGLITSYNVYVTAKSAVSIEIYKLPKTEYLEGENLSLDGGVISVKYNNGTSEHIMLVDTKQYGFDSYKIGEQRITVEYLGVETNYKITMYAKSAISIEVTKLPVTGYREGEKLTLDGGVITVKYNNGTSENVDLAKAEVWGFDTNKSGDQIIMVRYLDLEASYKVHIKAKQVASIEVNNTPKTDYIRGEELTLDGGTIGVKYDNGVYEEIALSVAKISGYDSNKIGEQYIVVEYEGRQTEFRVIVSEKKDDNLNDPTPVSEISANNVKIWSSEKTIFIENADANAEIRIADILGHLIKTVRATADRMEIPMQKAGIYIVKTLHKTQKVMIR